ncbi:MULTISPECIES: hypothetical protein [Halobacteriovorax]|uniref:Uncharacterized protein n=1 Tax=Halobacteriovorax vibrionivorans TaxID=2152716 RepID=A0ABY0IFH9_9BACT|nr:MULTISPECIES: hypothetical protein [Halobacteriovorax]AYF44509.1 hypothetical protein BALOs_1508 [Halobacteriovorax sp. BALOs_7]RZF20566.1 hypothetical protein DAY19_11310 [Halobacteriovorax vibrionivorans]TGD47479.1 hypothetical protein EP118_07840 [Halobacteriovorax sp. Y22]
MELSLYERVKIHAMESDFSRLSLDGQEVVYMGQSITAPSRWDKKLLRHSFALYGLIKREVLQIRFHLESNQVIESKIFKGRYKSVSDYKSIMNTMLELESLSRKYGLKILKAEIAHTHLSECRIDKKNLKFCMLSESDLQVAKRLKQFRNYPIEIKAIAKDGLVFKKVF